MAGSFDRRGDVMEARPHVVAPPSPGESGRSGTGSTPVISYLAVTRGSPGRGPRGAEAPCSARFPLQEEILPPSSPHMYGYLEIIRRIYNALTCSDYIAQLDFFSSSHYCD